MSRTRGKKMAMKKRGFSLIELLITITIMLFVLAGILALYLMSITTWHRGSTQIGLQRQASIVMERMVRGVDGRNGIREATSVSGLAVAGTIQYTSGIDGIQRSFSLTGTDITYDPDTSVAGNEYAVASDITALTFTQNASLITINMAMQDQVQGQAVDVDLSTTVRLRN
jgi:prepilin-type N-terminal cleavage/methylation domain-containing protein